MNAMNKWVWACLMSAVTATTAQAVVISGVTSATAIDPANEGDGTTWQNVNWDTTPAFRKFSTGSETYTKKNKAEMMALAGVQILNFESAQGFGTANRTIASTGNALSASTGIAPFTMDEAITQINLANGYTIDTAYRKFSTSTRTLSTPAGDSGVFLIGDRATNPALTSGTQGLLAGPAGGGVYMTFETNLSAFSAIFNCANSGSSSPTYIVALFDEFGTTLATYQLGVGNMDACHFGVESSSGNIRSVWVGQTTSNTGFVIDDVAFVAVPEPASVGIVLMGGIGALALLRKK